MSFSILVFDESKVAAMRLIDEIEDIVKNINYDITFYIYKPNDVFAKETIEKGKLIFFTIENMYDLEAARKFAIFHNDSTLIIVSNTEEFGTWSWELGADYYLVKPIERKELLKAIVKSSSIERKRLAGM